MKKENSKGKQRKNSTFKPSPRLLQTLRTLQHNDSGDVNYVFVNERIIFTNKFPLGKVIKVKTNLSAPINKAALYKEVKGRLVRRTDEEVYQLLDETAQDLGASYFIIS